MVNKPDKPDKLTANITARLNAEEDARADARARAGKTPDQFYEDTYLAPRATPLHSQKDRETFHNEWKGYQARKMGSDTIRLKNDVTGRLEVIILSKEIEDKICEAVRAGARPSVAALALGVTPAHFKQWCIGDDHAKETDNPLARSGNTIFRSLMKDAGLRSSDRPVESATHVYRFSKFADRVASAWAEARSEAEQRTFEQKPLDWLRQGPGRVRKGEVLPLIDTEEAWQLPEEELKAIANQRQEDKVIEVVYVDETNEIEDHGNHNDKEA